MPILRANQLAAEFGILARDLEVDIDLRFKSFPHIINFLPELIYLL
jgi:hypothetical protein